MNTQLKVIAGFILGAATGAAIGVLTAPRSGKKTRKMLKSEADQLREELQSKAEDQLDWAKKEYNKKLNEYTKMGKDVLEDIKNTVSTKK